MSSTPPPRPPNDAYKSCSSASSAPRLRRFGGRLGCPGTTSTTSPSPSTTASATTTTARPIQIWTSTLQRTILTATPIFGFPKIQWRALDEINSGVCDGMTYEEIKKIMPEEYESRKKDKLRYRYPRGESYLDVIQRLRNLIQRLEPVIIELERQRAPVVVISHQAVLRALYSYFADRPLREVPDMEMPYLDERSPLEMDYADSLSGIVEALTYTIPCIPIDASK
ncbi:6-phosphofructo-2-kinase/fructose-2,6-bisphosphatase isoform X4 [Lolium perenne]|uniref:6-phosphofructo-2-kinase/fructose-2, 6-bisphosphatase isoform X4 n=3 Tax=Lolium perenne TaxID=4522 RepID=UPI0021F57D60|nr:6-phosphofructo-2-kinase/fructose-2,6-bisphosphatase-like isoform X6 [Lolium perenne]